MHYQGKTKYSSLNGRGKHTTIGCTKQMHNWGANLSKMLCWAWRSVHTQSNNLNALLRDDNCSQSGKGPQCSARDGTVFVNQKKTTNLLRWGCSSVHMQIEDQNALLGTARYAYSGKCVVRWRTYCSYSDKWHWCSGRENDCSNSDNRQMHTWGKGEPGKKLFQGWRSVHTQIIDQNALMWDGDCGYPGKQPTCSAKGWHLVYASNNWPNYFAGGRCSVQLQLNDQNTLLGTLMGVYSD